MNRETTNKIRFILEDILPPIVRDSFIFKLIIRKMFKNKTLERLKSDILKISRKEYANLYKNLNRIHKDSDLSQICINEILKNIKPNQVLDVGCGEGFLLNKIKNKYKNISLTGIEMEASFKLKNKLKNKGIRLIEKKIENLVELAQKTFKYKSAKVKPELF